MTNVTTDAIDLQLPDALDRHPSLTAHADKRRVLAEARDTSLEESQQLEAERKALYERQLAAVLRGESNKKDGSRLRSVDAAIARAHETAQSLTAALERHEQQGKDLRASVRAELADRAAAETRRSPR
jgi:hypothetical protein